MLRYIPVLQEEEWYIGAVQVITRSIVLLVLGINTAKVPLTSIISQIMN